MGEEGGREGGRDGGGGVVGSCSEVIVAASAAAAEVGETEPDKDPLALPPP